MADGGNFEGGMTASQQSAPADSSASNESQTSIASLQSEMAPQQETFDTIVPVLPGASDSTTKPHEIQQQNPVRPEQSIADLQSEMATQQEVFDTDIPTLPGVDQKTKDSISQKLDNVPFKNSKDDPNLNELRTELVDREVLEKKRELELDKIMQEQGTEAMIAKKVGFMMEDAALKGVSIDVKNAKDALYKLFEKKAESDIISEMRAKGEDINTNETREAISAQLLLNREGIEKEVRMFENGPASLILEGIDVTLEQLDFETFLAALIGNEFSNGNYRYKDRSKQDASHKEITEDVRFLTHGREMIKKAALAAGIAVDEFTLAASQEHGISSLLESKIGVDPKKLKIFVQVVLLQLGKTHEARAYSSSEVDGIFSSILKFEKDYGLHENVTSKPVANQEKRAA